MALQWIHDKLKYYAELRDRLFESINQFEDDKKEYMQDLTTIERMFAKQNIQTISMNPVALMQN